METKICTKCNGEFPITFFYKNSRAKGGRVKKCNDCQRLYKQRMRLVKNNFEPDSMEHEMFNYFKKMDVYLNKTQVDDVVTTIEANKDKFFSTLDGLQKKYGAKAENYEDSLLSELREDRLFVQSMYVSRGAGRNSKRRVNQLDLDGKFIQTFSSIADAAMEVSGSVRGTGAISGCANGLSFQCYGFVWEYNDEWYDKDAEI